VHLRIEAGGSLANDLVENCAITLAPENRATVITPQRYVVESTRCMDAWRTRHVGPRFEPGDIFRSERCDLDQRKAA
jgi:hypothetical protein